MSDSYWKYTANPGKRPRIEYELAGSHDLSAYYGAGGDGRMAGGGRDIEAPYDRYMHHAMPIYGAGQSTMSIPGGFTGRPIEDSRFAGIGGFGRQAVAQNQPVSFGSGMSEMPLPADASSTLFVGGLPADCTRREVSHVFRPFNGYKEVRLVSKESRNPGGDPLVLCFVDFVSPAHATTALDALQGYQFDEVNHNSAILRLQYARFTGARSGGGRRGRR